MAMAMREKDQADFDLERFIDMFDQAMTSQDPRVVDALRSLMMMVILTKGETKDTMHPHRGPLRRLVDDVNTINRRLSDVEDRMRREISAKESELEQLKRWESQRAYRDPMDDYKLRAGLASIKAAQIPPLTLNDVKKWSPPVFADDAVQEKSSK